MNPKEKLEKKIEAISRCIVKLLNVEYTYRTPAGYEVANLAVKRKIEEQAASIHVYKLICRNEIPKKATKVDKTLKMM